MNVESDEITSETMRLMPYCQMCQHEWDVHDGTGCCHDYCSCHAWIDNKTEIIS